MKRALRQIAFSAAALLSLLLAVVLLLRVGSSIYGNHQLRAGFSASSQWQDYQQQLPISQMKFDSYAPLFAEIVAPIGYPTTFTTSAPIRYYRETDGKKTLACEIPAGTALDWSSSAPSGYGFDSFPTYEKGWRWGKPFKSADGQGDDAWYYIRTEDLEKAARQAFSSSQYLQASAKSAGLSGSEAVFALVRKTDRVFHQNGVYLSPDLFAPWTWDLICLAVLLLLMLTALWRFRRVCGCAHI